MSKSRGLYFHWKYKRNKYYIYLVMLLTAFVLTCAVLYGLNKLLEFGRNFPLDISKAIEPVTVVCYDVNLN